MLDIVDHTYADALNTLTDSAPDTPAIAIPPLTRHDGSWMVIHRNTRRVIAEVFRHDMHRLKAFMSPDHQIMTALGYFDAARGNDEAGPIFGVYTDEDKEGFAIYRGKGEDSWMYSTVCADSFSDALDKFKQHDMREPVEMSVWSVEAGCWIEPEQEAPEAEQEAQASDVE